MLETIADFHICIIQHLNKHAIWLVKIVVTGNQIHIRITICTVKVFIETGPVHAGLCNNSKMYTYSHAPLCNSYVDKGLG